MDKIRFGMIGGGAISKGHIPAIQANDSTEIICIADANAELARARADEVGAPRSCGSYDELMEMEDVDAVVVGIPTQFHADAVIKAAQAGKHALCEKPMARTLQLCRQMIDEHKAAGTTLGMAFVRRYDDNWGQIRKMIHEGKAGRPCMWRCIVAGAAPGPPNYGEWYCDGTYSDGPLTESGSHDIDFLRYTFGDVASVTAYMNHMADYGSVLDNAIVILQFESGDQALVQWSWSLPRGAASGFRGLDVIGPKGSIHEPRQEDGQWLIDISKGAGEMETVPFENRRDENTWFPGQLAGFVNAIREGGQPRGSGEDGYKAQEVFAAAVRSMETGCRIDLPLPTS
jgi:predicted dehydrogenase